MLWLAENGGSVCIKQLLSIIFTKSKQLKFNVTVEGVYTSYFFQLALSKNEEWRWANWEWRFFQHSKGHLWTRCPWIMKRFKRSLLVMTTLLGWVMNRGWNLSDINKGLSYASIRIPIDQPVFHGRSKGFWSLPKNHAISKVVWRSQNPCDTPLPNPSNSPVFPSVTP